MSEKQQAWFLMSEEERGQAARKEINKLEEKAVSASLQWIIAHKKDSESGSGLHSVATALLKWAQMNEEQRKEEPHKVNRHFKWVFYFARMAQYLDKTKRFRGRYSQGRRSSECTRIEPHRDPSRERSRQSAESKGDPFGESKTVSADRRQDWCSRRTRHSTY
jgi:hypothetical protein